VHTALNFITATAFLTHMLVGCCWHHAHACEEHAGASVALNHSTTDCDAHGHQHADHSESGDHGEDSSHDDCDGQSCVATCDLSSHGPNELGLFDLTFDLSPQTTQTFAITFERTQVERDTGPSVRPHLAHQVLLI